MRRALALAALATSVAACGGDDSAGDGDNLSAQAQRGAELAEDRGCTSCHGAGRIAPAWDGLFGSTVELEDGSTVVADQEYLTRAITDPGSEVVAGFGVEMPENDLSDDEVADLVAYIVELGGPPATSGETG